MYRGVKGKAISMKNWERTTKEIHNLFTTFVKEKDQIWNMLWKVGKDLAKQPKVGHNQWNGFLFHWKVLQSPFVVSRGKTTKGWQPWRTFQWNGLAWLAANGFALGFASWWVNVNFVTLKCYFCLTEGNLLNVTLVGQKDPCWKKSTWAASSASCG